MRTISLNQIRCDLITVHALEGSLSVNAELILTFTLFPNLALINVLKRVMIIYRLGEVLTNSM